LKRDTESGAFVIDLARHADVMEYAAWINSYSDIVYNAVWGDKVRGWGVRGHLKGCRPLLVCLHF